MTERSRRGRHARQGGARDTRDARSRTGSRDRTDAPGETDGLPAAYRRTPATPRYELSRDRGKKGRHAAGTAGTADGQATRSRPVSADEAAARAKAAPEREAFLPRVVGNWWNRLISAVFGGGFAEQTEQYLAHQTHRDYICNTIGQASWAALFPLLTMVTTWVLGAEQAGYFSMAYTIGLLLYFVGTYGVRTYQVSDIDEMQSFYDYQLARFLTCMAMLGVGLLICHVRYTGTMRAACLGVILYRTVDALAELYEGRLQQKDKFYLAGLSQLTRCVLAFACFTVVLLLSQSLGAACLAMTVGGVMSLLVLTLPLAYFETDRSLPLTLRGVRDVLVQCWPLFLALFLDNLIDAVPKFAMESALSYDNQLYYSAMFFPADLTVMVAGMIYRPQLVRLAHIWDDPSKHRRFDLLVVAFVAVIVAITAAMALFMGTLGVPLLSLMYNVDFSQFTSLALIMVVSGGICAVIDFLYQIVAILRAQQRVMRLYVIAFAFAVPVSVLLVSYSGLAGAVVGRLVTMALLLLLLVTEFLSIHKTASQGY